MKVSSLLSTSLGAVLGLRLFVNKKVFAFGRDDLLSRESVIPNPFHDDELNRNLEWRRQSELKAVQYRTSIAEPAYMKLRKRLDDGEISADQFRYDLLAVKERVLLDMQIIMFGTAERHARRNYVYEYGCVKWTNSALNIVKDLGPIVEIGAGGGHWAKELRDRGVDIQAYDNDSTDSPTPTNARKTKVLYGDEKKLSWYPHRTLLMVYPPPGNMAYNCLDQYKGDVIVYVGEGRGGVNANSRFFDKVEEEFDCVLIEPVEPFSKCYEKMFVLWRKAPRNHTLYRKLASWLW
eukprot:m.13649 g.13649  ORF g.13649 m.13649 type:complete len:292 (+) comp4180_c0_seq1:1-876(+)